MKISIVIPNFNRAEYLSEAIESVILQEYDDKELIVIDGGSTDGSVDIIKKYADQLTYWVSEKDKGQTDAINKGMVKASGVFVNWLNSDDRLVPGALQKIAKAAQEMPDADFLYGDMEVILEDGSVLQRRPEINYNRFVLRYGANLFAQPSCFYRKSFVDSIGGLDASLHWSMDYDLWIRAAEKGAVFRRVEGIISQFRLHGGSKTGSYHEKMRAQHFYCHQRMTKNLILKQEHVYKCLKFTARLLRLILLYSQRGVWNPSKYSKVLRMMNSKN